MSHLLSLPPETIVIILSHLPGPSLTACHLICRGIREVILSSPLLQYTQALKSSNLQDNPSSLLTPQEKLNILRKREKSWAFAELESAKSFSLDDAGGRYPWGGKHLADGVFIMREKHGTNLSVTNLLGQKEDLKWRTIDIGSHIIGSGRSAFEHDLIAVLTPSPSPDFTLSLLQLSTGRPHPKASLPVIPIPNPRQPSAVDDPNRLHHQIEIVGNHLVILQAPRQGSSAQVRKLYIYDWLVGTLKAEWSLENWYSCFAFLDADLLLLPNTTTHALDIHSIQDITENILKPQCSLLLPHAIDRTPLTCCVSPNPTGTIHTLQSNVPFRSNPQTAIVFFKTCIVGPEGPEAGFFVHRNVLADLCGSKSEPVLIPWSEWGPENTSWLTDLDGEFFCAGERVVCMSSDKSAYTVLDFNAPRVAKVQKWLEKAERKLYGDGDLEVDSSSLERLGNRFHRTWTSQGTGIDLPGLVVEQVRGNLPYAACSSPETFAWYEFFLDDERVVAVKPTSGCLRFSSNAPRDPPLLEVHTF